MSLLTGLVAYYKGDENTGSLVHDSVNSFDGTWSAQSWATGIINSGLNFTGGNYVDCGTPAPGFSGNQPFTISAWINPSAANASNAVFDYGQTGITGARISLIYIATYAIRSSHWSDDNTFTTTLDQNAWNHIVLSYDGTTESLYKNGTFEESWNPTPLSVSSGQPLLLGKSIDGFLTNATVNDELALYSRGLNSSEVSQLWNGGLGLQYPFTTSALTLGFLFPNTSFREKVTIIGY